MWTLLIACRSGAPPAPITSPCDPVFVRDLGDLPPAGDGTDARTSWSPDGGTLLVSSQSRLWLLDGSTGEVVAERTHPEALIRAIAWGQDGTVYAAEQSPDAFLFALDGDTLEERARARLADEVGHSPPPRADDPYGVYQLPAAYHLFASDEGVLAVAVHGWDTPDGRRNASRVLRLDVDLRVVAGWPAGGPADAVFGASATDGGEVAVAVRRSASGPPPADLPIDGVQRLRLPDLAPVGDVRLAALPGHGGVFVWDAVAYGPDGLAIGTGDGRVVTIGADGERRELPYATSARPGGASASVGTLRGHGQDVYTLTSRSWMPGSADGSLVPDVLHPEERALAAWSWAEGGLEPRWVWRGPYEWSGMVASDTMVVATAGARADDRRDLFGLARFSRDGGSPTVCPTEGAALAPALGPDGEVAGIEVPTTHGGVRQGPHQVSVWR